MQCTSCSVVKCIPMECSGFHAASLNADYSMHCGAMDPDCMQWSPCSEGQCILIDCSGFNAASLNAEDSMHCCTMDPDFMRWSPCSASSQHRWILNPLSEARNGICVLMDASQIRSPLSHDGNSQHTFTKLLDLVTCSWLCWWSWLATEAATRELPPEACWRRGRAGDLQLTLR